MADVLVIGTIRPEGLAVLEGRADIRLTKLAETDRAGLLEAAGRASAILVRTSRVDRAVIEAAPGLKVVSRHGVGYDNVDLEALNERRIPLAIAANANKVSVAEHALFMMLALAKQGVAHDTAVRGGEWAIRNRFAAVDLAGRTLLLLGFGRIGGEVAVRARAFGMTVEVFDPYVDDRSLAECGCRRATELESALREADVVSLHLPLSAATRHIIDAAKLALMRPTALLINTARGGLIDEPALARALTEGRLGGAGIDVFEDEPPDPANPLLAAPRALLSPHSAGVTGESMVRMATEAATNILDVLGGRLDPAVIVNHAIVAGSQP
ncbi:MAG: hydroxyacid dehydrogenase [Geminicoccaceae bacterium]|jgi:D-3-phosphoglycerate dehydrogenase|nr:hydroxyacid dehydrogenase [Geminicoccaceae bacterium]MCB9967752.1 hydroxyacid dehydrogenase [Geminicoccaceae bacterium]HRY26233.1 hydroxyacid dehydrogenase [Geminicoccaceae bacterium]